MQQLNLLQRSYDQFGGGSYDMGDSAAGKSEYVAPPSDQFQRSWDKAPEQWDQIKQLSKMSMSNRF